MAETEVPLYSKETLIKLLAAAKQLGFADDVAHWEAELAKVN